MPNNDYILRSDALNALMTCRSLTPVAKLEAVNHILPIPAADVEPKRRWIPVTDADNLPKKSTPCLVACNQWGGEIVRKATYLDLEKRFCEGYFDITEHVTHWMPSPEPPEGES